MAQLPGQHPCMKRRAMPRTPRTAKGNKRTTRKRPVAPRTAEQYFAQPEKWQGIWNRIVAAVSKMRGEKVSLEKASRESGVSPRTVKRWAGSALQKRTSGKWAPKKNDNLLRVLIVPTPKGKREIGVRGFRQASLLGSYWSSVHTYIATGDDSGLKKFRGKKLRDASGEEILLITDLPELNRLGREGSALSFESMYSRST
jgi:hypothetical protein